jgi:hypothetical protein
MSASSSVKEATKLPVGHRTRSIHESHPGGAYIPAGGGVAVDVSTSGVSGGAASARPPPQRSQFIKKIVKAWKSAKETVGQSKKRKNLQEMDPSMRRGDRSRRMAPPNQKDLPPLKPGFKRLKVDDFLPPHMNPYGEGAVMDVVDFIGSDAPSPSHHDKDEDDMGDGVERFPHRSSPGAAARGGGKQGKSSSGRVDTVSGRMTEGDSYFVYCPSPR